MRIVETPNLKSLLSEKAIEAIYRTITKTIRMHVSTQNGKRKQRHSPRHKATGLPNPAFEEFRELGSVCLPCRPKCGLARSHWRERQRFHPNPFTRYRVPLERVLRVAASPEAAIYVVDENSTVA